MGVRHLRIRGIPACIQKTVEDSPYLRNVMDDDSFSTFILLKSSVASEPRGQRGRLTPTFWSTGLSGVGATIFKITGSLTFKPMPTTTVGVGRTWRFCNTEYDQSQGWTLSTLKCIGSIFKWDNHPVKYWSEIRQPESREATVAPGSTAIPVPSVWPISGGDHDLSPSFSLYNFA